MNSSLFRDRVTHLKIVLSGLIGAIIVVGVVLASHLSTVNAPGTQLQSPAVSTSGPNRECASADLAAMREGCVS